MASTINASSTGSGGLITTGDASGELALQANGVTQATVSSTGLSLVPTASINALNTFGFENRIINGAMVIDQRNNGAAVTGAGGTAFTCDRWRAYNNGGGTLTFTQSSVVPNGNFANSVVLTVTATGTPSEAALTQNIEGYNTTDFGFGTANAVTVTASFWIRSSVIGTYCFSLRQGSGARSFVSPFTISSANTWQFVSVTIPGDTSGTYDKTNGSSFIYEICVGASTLQTSTTNAWQAGNFVSTSAQTNLLATNGATLYITGCQLEKGSQATSFDFRSIGAELALCQRYFSIGLNGGTDINWPVVRDALTSFQIVVTAPVPMRATPTLGVPSGFGRLVGYDTSFSLSVAGVSAMSLQWFLAGTQANIYCTNTSLSGSYVFCGYDTAGTSTNLTFSAEL